ncbi:hypothetical protein [Sneathiella aquimaris]|uniref:hypothetical protein n=1 Tax=Sneathiella aquimaris TaxID=2599305 RepID=UPI00146C802C|nr:hypothetical protein [Sneathiella aquimaris]
MITFFTFFGQQARLILALGVLIGLFLPNFGEIVAPALQVLVVLLLATAMIRVDLLQVLSHLKNPIKLGGLLFLLMIALPVIIHLACQFIGLSPVLHIALVLVACAPPLASAPSMAALLKLDDALVLNILVVGTLIVPFTVPLITLYLLELPLNLDPLSLLSRLLLTISLAIILAIFLRKTIGETRLIRYHKLMDGVSALIMLIFAIVIMNGIGLHAFDDMDAFVENLSAALFANWGIHLLFLIVFVASRKISKPRNSLISPTQGAVALMAGNRNAALFLATFPPETVTSLLLFIALAQFPIYLTPLASTPLYGWLTKYKESPPSPSTPTKI